MSSSHGSPPSLMGPPPSLRAIAREAARTPSPRFVFAFGASHPDAVFFATHEQYFETPSTLPPKLKSLFDTGETPLATLRLVALGPHDSFLAVSGIDAWWDLTCLDKRDRLATEQLLKGLASSTGPVGIDGIRQASFGRRGEFLLIYNNGTDIFSSDYPPPAPSAQFEQTLRSLPSKSVVNSCALGPGESFFVHASSGGGGKGKEVETVRCSPWSQWSQWPTREFEREIQGGQDGESLPLLRVYTSTMHPAYFYIVRTDGQRVETRYCLPANVLQILRQWLSELEMATYF